MKIHFSKWHHLLNIPSFFCYIHIHVSFFAEHLFHFSLCLSSYNFIQLSSIFLFSSSRLSWLFLVFDFDWDCIYHIDQLEVNQWFYNADPFNPWCIPDKHSESVCLWVSGRDWDKLVDHVEEIAFTNHRRHCPVCWGPK